jgi:hypothetical protein
MLTHLLLVVKTQGPVLFVQVTREEALRSLKLLVYAALSY